MKKPQFVYSTHEKTAQRGWFKWEGLQYTRTKAALTAVVTDVIKEFV